MADKQAMVVVNVMLKIKTLTKKYENFCRLFSVENLLNDVRKFVSEMVKFVIIM